MRGRPTSPRGPKPADAARLREGEALLQAGNFEKAADVFQRVLRKQPGHPGAALGYAQACAHLGRLDDALKVLAPLEGPNAGYGVHLVLADVRQQRGEVAEALAGAERAAAAQPRSPQAAMLVAQCLVRLNRVHDALDAARRAADLAPQSGEVRVLLGAVLRRSRDFAAARIELEAALPRLEQRPLDRAEALHELGFALDGLGAYEEAFGRFTEAGALDYEIGRRRGVNVEFARHVVATYRDGVTPELFRRFGPGTFDDGHPKLAFLVGFPRSGTTMTEQVLAAHEGVVTSDEESFLRPVRDAVADSRRDVTSIVERLMTLDEKAIVRLRRSYWKSVRKSLGRDIDGRLVVDKFPLNINHIALINVVFPDARLLVAIRDPRDVCLSCFMQAFALNTGMINFTALDRTVALYRDVMDLWLRQREMTTLPYLEFRYEDTVRDLPARARAILEHLELPWNDAVLAFHEKARERVISTPSAAAVTEPVHTRAVGRWERYRFAFEPLLPMLAPFVDAFGYDA